MSKVNVESTTDAPNVIAEAKGDYKVEAYGVDDKTDVVSESAPLAIQAAEPTTDPEPVETEDSPEDPEAEILEAAEEPGKGKKKTGYQRRMDKLTKQREDAKRDADYWRTEALKAKGQPEPTKVEAKPAADISKMPKPDDFEKHDDYIQALTDFKVDQKLAGEKAQQREQALKAEQKTHLKSHLDRVTEFAKATPDFKDAMQDIADVRLSMTVNNAIIESEHGPQLMYEFAKNPAELERINALAPEVAARAIGRLEAKFESSAGKTNDPAPTSVPEKKVTTAPKPITPVNSKAGHTKTIRDDLPYEDWVKIRRADMRPR